MPNAIQTLTLAVCAAAACAETPRPLPPSAVRHVVVHYQPERFCGWPANNGVWIWGNEILVGFVLGHYKAQDDTHSIDREKPQASVLARSRDGGETWTLEDPDNFVLDGGKPAPSPGGIRFGHPDFAMRVGNHTLIGNKDEEGQFFVSYDRGKRWEGPYLFPSFGLKMTSRTDYLVEGPQSCLIFLSAEYQGVKGANYRDRAFAVRTDDGGKRFQRLGWMAGESIDARAVMPSTVRLSKGRLLTALRRKTGSGDAVRNWIEIFESPDNGVTWKSVSTAVEGLPGNGNPPSMVRLNDGRLVVTYGDRTAPSSIQARISADEGRTWSRTILLRGNGRTFDIGYPRTVQRPDGKLVTIYYFTTNERPEMHIAATIWDPAAVK
jgi:hypothetical protein